MTTDTQINTVREMREIIKDNEKSMDSVIDKLTIPQWLLIAHTDKSLKHSILNSRRIRTFKATKTFNLDCFEEIIGENEIKCLLNTYPEVEKIIVGTSNCQDKLFDRLRKLPNLKKLQLFLEKDDINCNMTNLNINSVSSIAKFNLCDSCDPIFYHLIQLDDISKLSIIDGYLSKKTVERLEKYKLEKFKLHNTHIESELYATLLNMIKNNKNLKKLNLTTDDFLTNPHETILMSEFVCRLKKRNKLTIENLKFTLDQACRVKYQNLSFLKNLKNIYVYYNVQQSLCNLTTLLEATYPIPNIHITLREFITPFPSCSKYENIQLQKYEELSKQYANDFKMFETKITVFPAKY